MSYSVIDGLVWYVFSANDVLLSHMITFLNDKVCRLFVSSFTVASTCDFLRLQQFLKAHFGSSELTRSICKKLVG